MLCLLIGAAPSVDFTDVAALQILKSLLYVTLRAATWILLMHQKCACLPWCFNQHRVKWDKKVCTDQMIPDQLLMWYAGLA